MSFELKVTQDFLDLTSLMAEKLKTLEAAAENGNIFLVKIPLINTSVLEIVKGKFQQDQIYQSGIGRVIATPRLLNKETDADVKVGDFVMYSHASKYTVSSLITHWLFGFKLAENQPHDFIEEYNSFPVIAITDRDVMLRLDSAKIAAV